jgi:uncharacterized protein YuzE
LIRIRSQCVAISIYDLAFPTPDSPANDTPNKDALTVISKEGASVSESDEHKPGVILNYDQEGNLLSLEILDASEQVTQTRKIEYETIETLAV